MITKYVTKDEIRKQLFTLICKGDAGDSIPNFLMEDNAIAVKTRQKPIYQKKVDVWYEDINELPEDNYFKRNRKLIDFRCIPKIIKTEILKEYEREINKPKPNLIKYFMNFGVSEFIDEMIDFQ